MDQAAGLPGEHVDQSARCKQFPRDHPDAAAGTRTKAAASDALRALRWNWDEAYAIDYDAARGWRAVRGDGIGEPLTARTADELRDAIWDDYNARPVPRQNARPVARKRGTRR